MQAIIVMLGLLATLSAPGAPRRVLVHGHRGTRGTRPENTLPAFQEAVAAGADVLELDLHLTSDNVLVISHDPAIEGRLCRDPGGEIVKQPLFIRRLTAAQVAEYDCGSVRNPDFPDQVLVPHTPKPRFEDLVRWVVKNAPKVEMNIETKMDMPDPRDNPDPKYFATAIIQMLHRYGVTDRSILQSFDFRTLVEAKKIEPRLRLSALTQNDREFCVTTLKTGAQIASPYYRDVDRKQVALCHQRGVQVAPWTPDRLEEWKALIADGVDALITDYPRKLIAYLKGNP